MLVARLARLESTVKVDLPICKIAKFFAQKLNCLTIIKKGFYFGIIIKQFEKILHKISQIGN